MSELDDLLARLHGAPIPSLSAIDQRVMAGLSDRHEARLARRGLALAGSIAIVVGVVSTFVPRSAAEARPLLDMPEAAPSHLLVD